MDLPVLQQLQLLLQRELYSWAHTGNRCKLQSKAANELLLKQAEFQPFIVCLGTTEPSEYSIQIESEMSKTEPFPKSVFLVLAESEEEDRLSAQSELAECLNVEEINKLIED